MNVAISAAMSTSRITDSAAVIFSMVVARLAVAYWRRFWAAPISPRTLVRSVMASSTISRALCALAADVRSMAETAVDPADLNPDVAASPNVTHLRGRAEEVPADTGQFHLITNDMNIDPSESAKIMVELADHLRKGGAALMTVKFVTRNRRKHVKEAIETLKARYKDFETKRLRHNRFETTLFMRKI